MMEAIGRLTTNQTLPKREGPRSDESVPLSSRRQASRAWRYRVGMENEIVLLTTIPAGEPVKAYGRESWVSV